jgi:hypothetical protein
MENLPTRDLPTRIYVDSCVVDFVTGEIIAPDHYQSIYLDRSKPQPSLGTCRSVDDLQDFLEDVDLRKLPPMEVTTLADAQDYAHGVWRRTGLDCRITVPMMNTLVTLQGLVKYGNIIILTKAALAKALGVSESNLIKKLAPLRSANLVRVLTSRQGIRTGEIKLLVNPRLVFRGYDTHRDQYVKRWYTGDTSDALYCNQSEHLLKVA